MHLYLAQDSVPLLNTKIAIFVKITSEIDREALIVYVNNFCEVKNYAHFICKI